MLITIISLILNTEIFMEYLLCYWGGIIRIEIERSWDLILLKIEGFVDVFAVETTVGVHPIQTMIYTRRFDDQQLPD